MRAAICTRYGPPDVLQVREVPKPKPADDEVLIKVHASTVTAGDCELRRFDFPIEFWVPFRLMFGLRRPRNPVFGQELAGEVERVGASVHRFREGDQVFAATTFRFGAHAEYICLRESSSIAKKPANLSFAEAAGVPIGALNALHFLREADVKPGESVLVNGAGGSIGTMAVQLARHMGAEVTGVDHGDKLEMLRSIGASHVIDYRQTDFTETGTGYDVILDVAATSSYTRSVRSLNPNGRYLLATLRLHSLIRGPWTSRTSDKRVIHGLAPQTAAELDEIRELIESEVIMPVIDRRYPLDQIVDAHRYVEQGRKQGSLIVQISASPGSEAADHSPTAEER